MPKPPPPPTSPLWKVFHLVTRLDMLLIRATKGRRSLVIKSPPLVLHHVGRKSGTARTSPLVYLDESPNLVVIASRGGSDAHPDWYRNLMAMESTEVDLPGGERRRVRPRTASEAERAEYWPKLVARHADFESYRTYTDRTFPIVVLEPA